MLLVAAAALAACSARALPPDALRAWVADPAHGLTLTDSAGALTATCTYRPPDLLAAQEVRNAGRPLTAAALDSARRLYVGSSRFALSLRQAGAEYETALAADPTRYAAAVRYLSEGLAHDVWLRLPGRADSVRARAALYAPQYGVGNGRSTVLLVFPVPSAELAGGAHLTVAGAPDQMPRLRFRFGAEAFRGLPPLAAGP